VILAAGTVIELDDLPSPIGRFESAASDGAGRAAADRPSAPAAEPLTLEQLEATHIRRVLDSTATMDEAAAKLGINPSTLYRKRKRYGI
jgi:NtrC-family two-component system response regulator AlgB